MGKSSLSKKKKKSISWSTHLHMWQILLLNTDSQAEWESPAYISDIVTWDFFFLISGGVHYR